MSKTILIEKAILMEEIRQLISQGKTVTITVKGNSMNPFMVHMRDQMTLGPWKDEDLREGTVALVLDSRGTHLIHRIIKREKDRVILMGDGNVGLREDAEVKDVLGLMLSVKRKGRTYQTEGLTWRLYSWLWMALTPLRRWPLGLWRRLRPQQPLR